MTKITAEFFAKACEKLGAFVDGDEAAEMATQCNEQAGINGRDSAQWAHFFAKQIASEQGAEAFFTVHEEAAMYGTD